MNEALLGGFSGGARASCNQGCDNQAALGRLYQMCTYAPYVQLHAVIGYVRDVRGCVRANRAGQVTLLDRACPAGCSADGVLPW